MQLFTFMFTALTAVQVPQENLAAITPVDYSSLADFFGASCFKSLDNPAGVAAAVEASDYDLDPQDKQKIGKAWIAPSISIYYVAKGELPGNLPTPQCSIRAQIDASGEHLDRKAMLERKLGITGGKSKGKGGVFQSEWNFADADGGKRRMFFKSHAMASGKLQVSLTLFRLKPPKTNYNSNNES